MKSKLTLIGRRSMMKSKLTLIGRRTMMKSKQTLIGRRGEGTTDEFTVSGSKFFLTSSSWISG